jgi:hypothetical protein
MSPKAGKHRRFTSEIPRQVGPTGSADQPSRTEPAPKTQRGFYVNPAQAKTNHFSPL